MICKSQYKWFIVLANPDKKCQSTNTVLTLCLIWPKKVGLVFPYWLQKQMFLSLLCSLILCKRALERSWNMLCFLVYWAGPRLLIRALSPKEVTMKCKSCQWVLFHRAPGIMNSIGVGDTNANAHCSRTRGAHFWNAMHIMHMEAETNLRQWDSLIILVSASICMIRPI